jgi:hypothetical protein
MDNTFIKIESKDTISLINLSQISSVHKYDTSLYFSSDITNYYLLKIILNTPTENTINLEFENKFKRDLVFDKIENNLNVII